MEQLREILDEVFAGQDYTSCDDFMEAGMLDSMDVMDLVEQLEAAYDIEISGRDIVPENFKSVDAMVELLKKYIED